MILVLRPEPGAGDTVRRARDRGLEAVAAPLFAIEPVAWALPDPAEYDALLLTSANAARHGGEQLAALRGLPVHAVGEATAAAAREAGLAIASTGDADVGRLLQTIDPALRLLHLCGEDRHQPEGVRQAITSLVAYRATPIEADLAGAEGCIALIHSPRAARRFAALVDPSRRPSIRIAAISEAAAQAVGEGWQKVETAARPNDEALLALAARLCHKPGSE